MIVADGGDLVMFRSSADNLVADDNNETADYFLRNLSTGVTEVGATGDQGQMLDRGAGLTDMTPDGRFIVFATNSQNVVAGTVLPVQGRVFLRDRESGAFTRVSDESVNANGALISDDGSRVVYRVGLQVWLWERGAGSRELTGLASSAVGRVALSGNGRWLVFDSSASLVPKDEDTFYDIYRHDIDAGTTELVSIGTDGSAANHQSYEPDASYGGQYVAFRSYGNNLVATPPAYFSPGQNSEVYVRDMQAGVTELISITEQGGYGGAFSFLPSISADGFRVAFGSRARLTPTDTTAGMDSYVRDRIDGTTTLVTVAKDGTQQVCTPCEGAGGPLAPKISADGNAVGFTTPGTGLDPRVNDGDWPQAYVRFLTPRDQTPPATTDMAAMPSSVAVGYDVTITATIDDTATGGSPIAGGELRVRKGGDYGPYQPMQAADGAYDEVTEDTRYAIPGGFAETGVYEVCARGSDAAGNVGGDTCMFLPAYDPDGGFVTGGGWIDSPPGAYTPEDPTDPDVTGRANLGFVSKYKKGATTPSGQTQFRFTAGDLNFHSTAYEWLVVAGAKAQFKGSGQINGAGDYGFLLTARDGQVSGGGGTDAFRIKIWDTATDEVVYDNQAGDGDDADAAAELGGGSIVIHK